MAAEELTRITVKASSIDRARIQFVELGGVRIGLKTQFSKFDSLWRLWLLDLAGVQIAGPITLVPGLDLLLGCKHLTGVPQGEMFVQSEARTAPDADSMDTTHALYYRGT